MSLSFVSNPLFAPGEGRHAAKAEAHAEYLWRRKSQFSASKLEVFLVPTSLLAIRWPGISLRKRAAIYIATDREADQSDGLEYEKKGCSFVATDREADTHPMCFFQIS